MEEYIDSRNCYKAKRTGTGKGISFFFPLAVYDLPS